MTCGAVISKQLRFQFGVVRFFCFKKRLELLRVRSDAKRRYEDVRMSCGRANPARGAGKVAGVFQPVRFFAGFLVLLDFFGRAAFMVGMKVPWIAARKVAVAKFRVRMGALVFVNRVFDVVVIRKFFMAPLAPRCIF